MDADADAGEGIVVLVRLAFTTWRSGKPPSNQGLQSMRNVGALPDIGQFDLPSWHQVGRQCLSTVHGLRRQSDGLVVVDRVVDVEHCSGSQNRG